jgi:pilus assembly protein CpaE
MLATLDRTDELLVLCGLDVPTLKNVRLAMQTLELLSFPSRRIRYVLNRANTKVGLNKREVENALKVTVHSEVPSDRIVPVCVNRGTPAVLAEPSSEFAKAIVELAKAVMTPADKQAKPRKRLSLSRS